MPRRAAARATHFRTRISIPTPSDPGRRRFLALTAAAAGALILPGAPARAATAAQARGLVEALVAEITAMINSGRAEAQMLRGFEQIFLRYADVAIIAQTTLGSTGAAPATPRSAPM
jgi:phospholipid transport system substrate-binding protein